MRFLCRVPVDGHTVAGVIPSVETSAEIAPSFQAGLTAHASGAEGVLSYRSRQDGSVRSARPARVRRLFAKGAGVFEKRRPPRRKMEMTVEFDQGESRGIGVTGDVSRSGMFVRSAQVPSVGPSLNLTVHLPGGRELSLRGRVVRSTSAFGISPSRGFGLRLTDKPSEYDNLLSRFLDPSG